MAWKLFYEHFGNRYRVISWDYRGLFHSDPPKNPQNLTIKDHVRDLDAILKKEEVSEAVVAGWSMGVQVNLEYYRMNPKLYRCMILLNGTSGNPFHTALGSPLSRYIFPRLNSLAKRLVPAVQPALKPLAKRIIDWKGFVSLISKMGLVHPNLNSKIFQEVAREMINADLQIYHEIMHHLNDHDASPILSQVKVPLLLIAGDQDLLTPMKVAERMASLCVHSELFIVPHGTHYTILEFPDIVNLRVQRFLEENYPAQKDQNLKRKNQRTK